MTIITEKNKSGDSSLHDWFNKSKSSDGKKGWVQLGGKYAGKPCAKQPGQKTKPKCGSSKMKRNLNKKEEAAAFRRKNREDPNPNRKGQAINVRTEETIDQSFRRILEEKKAQKCWPGYEKKGTKKMFGKTYNNCVKKEEVELEEKKKAKKDYDGDGKIESGTQEYLGSRDKAIKKAISVKEGHYGSAVNKIPKELDKAVALHSSQAKRLRASDEFKKDAGKTANKIPGQLDKAVAMHTKQAKQLRDAGVGDEKNCGCGQTPCKTYGKKKKEMSEGKKDACYHKVKSRYSVWPSAYASGALVKCRKVGAANWGNKTKKESYSWRDDFDYIKEGAAWTRKEGKNKSGGLNEKGRKSYERENPGSDLKAPSKKKGNKRRKSFCARMKGMKKKLTSKKTARDPNSRINKSLRAWNC